MGNQPELLQSGYAPHCGVRWEWQSTHAAKLGPTFLSTVAAAMAAEAISDSTIKWNPTIVKVFIQSISGKSGVLTSVREPSASLQRQ